jgi:hypothetical protein
MTPFTLTFPLQSLFQSLNKNIHRFKSAHKKRQNYNWCSSKSNRRYLPILAAFQKKPRNLFGKHTSSILFVSESSKNMLQRMETLVQSVCVCVQWFKIKGDDHSVESLRINWTCKIQMSILSTTCKRKEASMGERNGGSNNDFLSFVQILNY